MKFLKRYSVIFVGSIIFAIGFSMFLSPVEITPGGLSGIIIIISHYYKSAEQGLLFLLFNIPLLIIGFFYFGKSFLFGTFFATLVSSATMTIIENYCGNYLISDLFGATFAGSVLLGIGLGLVFKENATTGGVDIIVKLIKNYYPKIKSGYIFIVIDSLILIMSSLVYKDILKAVYGAFVISVSNLFFNYVLYGKSDKKILIIIDDDTDLILDQIKELFKIIVVDKKYSSDEQKKQIITCVISKRHLSKALQIITEYFPNAFVLSLSADEIILGGDHQINEIAQ